ncbi:MAG: PhnD/SsuA/transferrin family substrate-binding protein, partial [Desulfuromonadaceae bacterium]
GRSRSKRYLGRVLTKGLAGLLLLAGVLFSSIPAQATTDDRQFRLGFSARIFTGVNDNDALAAIKVWAETINREQKFSVEPTSLILRGEEEIRQALSQQKIDALTLPLDEYWRVREFLDQQVFICSNYDGNISQEYVLLVHGESDIHQLQDLDGRKLNFMEGPQMSLAQIWLDTILIQSGMPAVEQFCRVSYLPHLAKTLLPVFFRQCDACVVTREGFKIMNELNPQIGRGLRILATSPKLVASGFAFTKNVNSPLRGKIIKQLTQITHSPAGAQVMKLFKSGSFKAEPIACLDSAFELLTTHEHLLDKNPP